MTASIDIYILETAYDDTVGTFTKGNPKTTVSKTYFNKWIKNFLSVNYPLHLDDRFLVCNSDTAPKVISKLKKFKYQFNVVEIYED